MDEKFSGMKYIFLPILLLFTFPLRVNGDNLKREIITAEMIRSSGLIRVGDILLLADGLNANSMDGYTWRVSMSGLSSFQRQNWTVMLDGQRIELSSFDLIHLNMLSTVIDKVSFVEIFNLPQIYEGEFVDQGLIHIHTNKPKSGILIQGDVAAGSETKDPGPYTYTEFATPNVDRMGKDLSTTIDFAFKNWYFRMGLMTQTHSFTDLAMVKRNQSIYAGDGFMALERTLSFLKMGLERFHGKHEFLASYSNADKYFLFFKPVGREIPVDYMMCHVGINGNFSISENLGLTYRLKYSRNQINEFPNTLDFDFDWKSSNFYANLEGDFESVFDKSKLGVGFDRFHLDTSYQLENDFHDVGKVYGIVNYSLADNVQQGINVLTTFSGGKIGIKGALTNNWQVGSKHEVSTILSFSQRLLEEDNNLWYWSERGYDLLKENDVNYTIIGHIGKSKQVTADVIWEHNLNCKLTLETAGSYRFFYDLYLEKQLFDFHPEDYSFSSPVQIYANQGGQTLGGHFALKYRPVAQLKHSFFYSYRTTIAGDDVFKDVWKSIPKHKASYRLIYNPVENFSIWAMLSYLSSSNWMDYQNIDGKSYVLGRINVKYSSTVKKSTIFDLQFRKWLWRRRLQASLLLRNVWDKNYRYHPIGASFDLGFYVHLRGFFSIINF